MSVVWFSEDEIKFLGWQKIIHGSKIVFIWDILADTNNVDNLKDIYSYSVYFLIGSELLKCF